MGKKKNKANRGIIPQITEQGVPEYSSLTLEELTTAIKDLFYRREENLMIPPYEKADGSLEPPFIEKIGEWYRIGTGRGPIIWTREGGYQLLLKAFKEKGFGIPNNIKQ